MAAGSPSVPDRRRSLVASGGATTLDLPAERSARVHVVPADRYGTTALAPPDRRHRSAIRTLDGRALRVVP